MNNYNIWNWESLLKNMWHIDFQIGEQYIPLTGNMSQ